MSRLHQLDEDSALSSAARFLHTVEMKRATYIHGTASRERARLSELNRLTNATFVRFLDVHPNMRVLEAGSGLGILAAEVAAAAPGVEVTGVEISAEQLASAAVAPSVRFVHGDVHELRFPDDSFDLVYARYLLEHVADPERVVHELRRVVRPGGRVALCENDISLLHLDPPCPLFEQIWSDFARYQSLLGGDALIGRRLFRLLRNAGFDDVQVSVQPELHVHGTPHFASWIENLAGNIEGARAGLVASSVCEELHIERALGELRGLLAQKDASSLFVWNRAVARK